MWIICRWKHNNTIKQLQAKPSPDNNAHIWQVGRLKWNKTEVMAKTEPLTNCKHKHVDSTQQLCGHVPGLTMLADGPRRFKKPEIAKVVFL